MTSCLQHHQTASAGPLAAAAVQGMQVDGNMEVTGMFAAAQQV
jgi:hypothetical protein